MGLLACPFCREMFEEGEAKTCPVCGMALTEFAKLPPSIEAMHDEVKARTLFATHYHELTRLAGRLDRLSLHHVRAREWKGDLVLLHEVANGAADRSYGIAVAKLAGLPPTVVARAKSVLAKLEAGRDATGGIENVVLPRRDSAACKVRVGRSGSRLAPSRPKA